MLNVSDDHVCPPGPLPPGGLSRLQQQRLPRADRILPDHAGADPAGLGDVRGKAERSDRVSTTETIPRVPAWRVTRVCCRPPTPTPTGRVRVHQQQEEGEEEELQELRRDHREAVQGTAGLGRRPNAVVLPWRSTFSDSFGLGFFFRS